MRNKRFIIFAIALMMVVVLAACSGGTTLVDTATSSDLSTGQIYLYGEHHGVEEILEKELGLWHEYYHEENMRHLFIELPYYSAEFLNLWMQSDSDDIMDELYKDWEGTASYNPYIREFYKKIKSEYPETIFRGTDVGHQYHTTGQRFLKYLEENNLESTDKYLLAQKSIEQGEYYYKHSDDVYRENKMVENFISEFDKLKSEDIMGIYGGAHTNLDSLDWSNSVPCMANQLKERYGDTIYSEDLSWLAQEIEPLKMDKPLRMDTITISGKSYEHFKDKGKTGNVLPYDNYPMLIETGQVFVIDHMKLDDSAKRVYYRSDGYIWEDRVSTEEFMIE